MLVREVFLSLYMFDFVFFFFGFFLDFIFLP